MISFFDLSFVFMVKIFTITEDVILPETDKNAQFGTCPWRNFIWHPNETTFSIFRPTHLEET